MNRMSWFKPKILLFIMLFGVFMMMRAQRVGNTLHRVTGSRISNVHQHENRYDFKNAAPDSKAQHSESPFEQGRRDQKTVSADRSSFVKEQLPKKINLKTGAHVGELFTKRGLPQISVTKVHQIRSHPITSSTAATQQPAIRIFKQSRNVFASEKGTFPWARQKSRPRVSLNTWRIILQPGSQTTTRPANVKYRTALAQIRALGSKRQKCISQYLELSRNIRRLRLMFRLSHRDVLRGRGDSWRLRVALQIRKRIVAQFLRQRQRFLREIFLLDKFKRRLIRRLSKHLNAARRASVRLRIFFPVPSWSKERHLFPSRVASRLIIPANRVHKFVFPVRREVDIVFPWRRRFLLRLLLTSKNQKGKPLTLFSSVRVAAHFKRTQHNQNTKKWRVLLRSGKTRAGHNLAGKLNSQRRLLLRLLRKSKVMRALMLMRRHALQMWENSKMRNRVMRYRNMAVLRRKFSTFLAGKYGNYGTLQHATSWNPKQQPIHSSPYGRRSSPTVKEMGPEHRQKLSQMNTNRRSVGSDQRAGDQRSAQRRVIHEYDHVLLKLLTLSNQSMQPRIEEQQKLVQELKETLQLLKRHNSWLKDAVVDKLTKIYDLFKHWQDSVSQVGSPFFRVLAEISYGNRNNTQNANNMTTKVGYFTLKSIDVTLSKKINIGMVVAQYFKQTLKCIRQAIIDFFQAIFSYISHLYLMFRKQLGRIEMPGILHPDAQHDLGHDTIRLKQNVTYIGDQHNDHGMERSGKKSHDWISYTQFSRSNHAISEVSRRVNNTPGPQVAHRALILHEYRVPGLPSNTRGPGKEEKRPIGEANGLNKSHQIWNMQFSRRFLGVLLIPARNNLTLQGRASTATSNGSNKTNGETKPGEIKTAQLLSADRSDTIRLESKLVDDVINRTTAGDTSVNQSEYRWQESWRHHFVLMLNHMREIGHNGSLRNPQNVVKWTSRWIKGSQAVFRHFLWLSQLPQKFLGFIRRLELANLRMRMRLLSQILAKTRRGPSPFVLGKVLGFVGVKTNDLKKDDSEFKKDASRVRQWHSKNNQNGGVQKHSHNDISKMSVSEYENDAVWTAARPSHKTNADKPFLVMNVHFNSSEKHQKQYTPNVTMNKATDQNRVFSPVLKIFHRDRKQTLNITMNKTNNTNNRNQVSGPALTNSQGGSKLSELRLNKKSPRYESQGRSVRKLLSVFDFRSPAGKFFTNARNRKNVLKTHHSQEEDIHTDAVKLEPAAPEDDFNRYDFHDEQSHGFLSKADDGRGNYQPNLYGKIKPGSSVDNGSSASQLPQLTGVWLKKMLLRNRNNDINLKRHFPQSIGLETKRNGQETNQQERGIHYSESGGSEYAGESATAMPMVSAETLRHKLLSLLKLVRESHIYDRYDADNGKDVGDGKDRGPDTVSPRYPLAETDDNYNDINLMGPNNFNSYPQPGLATARENAKSTDVLSEDHHEASTVADKVVEKLETESNFPTFPLYPNHQLPMEQGHNGQGVQMPSPRLPVPSGKALDGHDNGHTDTNTGHSAARKPEDVQPTQADIQLLKNIEMLTYKALGMNGGKTDGSFDSTGKYPGLDDILQQGRELSFSTQNPHTHSPKPDVLHSKQRWKSHDLSRMKRKSEFGKYDVLEPPEEEFLIKVDLMKDLRRKWVMMKRDIRKLQSEIYAAMDNYSNIETDIERLLRRGNAMASADVRLTKNDKIYNTMNVANWKLAQSEFKRFQKDIHSREEEFKRLNQKAMKSKIHTKLTKLGHDFNREKQKIDYEIQNLLNSTSLLPVKAPRGFDLNGHQSLLSLEKGRNGEDSGSDQMDYVDEDGIAHYMNEIDALHGYPTEIGEDHDLKRVEQLLDRVILRQTRAASHAGGVHKYSALVNKTIDSSLQDSGKEDIYEPTHNGDDFPKPKDNHQTSKKRLKFVERKLLNLARGAEAASNRRPLARHERALTLDDNGEVTEKSTVDLGFPAKWRDLKKAIETLQKNVAIIIEKYSKAEAKVEKLMKSSASVDNKIYGLTNVNAVNSTINNMKWEAVRKDLITFRNEIRRLDRMVERTDLNNLAQNLKGQIKNIRRALNEQNLLIVTQLDSKADPNMLFTFGTGIREDLASLDYFDAIRENPKVKAITNLRDRVSDESKDYNPDSTAILEDQLSDLNKYEENINSISDLRVVDDRLHQMLLKTAMGPSFTEELERGKREAWNPPKAPPGVKARAPPRNAPKKGWDRKKVEDMLKREERIKNDTVRSDDNRKDRQNKAGDKGEKNNEPAQIGDSVVETNLGDMETVENANKETYDKADGAGESSDLNKGEKEDLEDADQKNFEKDDNTDEFNDLNKGNAVEFDDLNNGEREVFLEAGQKIFNKDGNTGGFSDLNKGNADEFSNLNKEDKEGFEDIEQSKFNQAGNAGEFGDLNKGEKRGFGDTDQKNLNMAGNADEFSNLNRGNADEFRNLNKGYADEFSDLNKGNADGSSDLNKGERGGFRNTDQKNFGQAVNDFGDLTKGNAREFSGLNTGHTDEFSDLSEGEKEGFEDADQEIFNKADSTDEFSDLNRGEKEDFGVIDQKNFNDVGNADEFNDLNKGNVDEFNYLNKGHADEFSDLNMGEKNVFGNIGQKQFHQAVIADEINDLDKKEKESFEINDQTDLKNMGKTDSEYSHLKKEGKGGFEKLDIADPDGWQDNIHSGFPELKKGETTDFGATVNADNSFLPDNAFNFESIKRDENHFSTKDVNEKINWNMQSQKHLVDNVPTLSDSAGEMHDLSPGELKGVRLGVLKSSGDKGKELSGVGNVAAGIGGKDLVKTKRKTLPIVHDLNLMDLTFSENNEGPSEFPKKEERDGLDVPGLDDSNNGELYKQKRRRNELNTADLHDFWSGDMDQHGVAEKAEEINLQALDDLASDDLNKPISPDKNVLPTQDAQNTDSIYLRPFQSTSKNDDVLLDRLFPGEETPILAKKINELDLQELYSENEDLNLDLPQEKENDKTFLELAELAKEDLELPFDTKGRDKLDLQQTDVSGINYQSLPIMKSQKGYEYFPRWTNIDTGVLILPNKRGAENDKLSQTPKLKSDKPFLVKRSVDSAFPSHGEHHHSNIRRRQAHRELLPPVQDVINDVDGQYLAESIKDDTRQPIQLKLHQDLRGFWSGVKEDMESRKALGLSGDFTPRGDHSKLEAAVNLARQNTIKAANRPIISNLDTPGEMDYELDHIQNELTDGFQPPTLDIPSGMDAENDLDSFDEFLPPEDETADSNLVTVLQGMRRSKANPGTDKFQKYIGSDQIFRQIQKAENYLNAEITTEREAEEKAILKEIKRQQKDDEKQRLKDEADMRWAARHESEAMKDLEAITKDITQKKIKEYKHEVAEIKKAMKEEEKEQEKKRKEWHKELELLKKY